MLDDYERVILVKPEIFVYRIPPRTTNRAYKAADWKLDAPDWTGRLRIVSKGSDCLIKLEDKTSGELYAACPVDNYPGTAIESVSDSARYFVIRLKDDSNRSAFVGIGFYDRSDSFDFNVALQDYFKHLKQAKEEESQPVSLESEKKLDLRFKEGQTFTLNLGKKDTESNVITALKSKSRPTGNTNANILLPPPPVATRPLGLTTTATAAKATTSQSKSNVDLLLDLDLGTSERTSQSSNTNNWVQF